MIAGHPNPRVEALLAVARDMESQDWIDLALAAIDQAGLRVPVQDRIEQLVVAEGFTGVQVPARSS